MQHHEVFGPMECLAIDIIGPLPLTKDGNNILWLLDIFFSKWKEAFALEDHTDSCR